VNKLLNIAFFCQHNYNSSCAYCHHYFDIIITVIINIKLVHNFELASQCLMYAAYRRMLSLRFNGNFPGESELASVCWSKGWWRWWWQLNYWSYKSCKAPVKSSPTNQHPVSFTGWMPFLSPNQQCQITEGKNIIFHELAYPKLTWGRPTLSLTTNNSWLPWGRVAMPLISPLIPVPRLQRVQSI